MNLLTEIDGERERIQIYSDNKSTNNMGKNCTSSVKHIDIKFHFLKHYVNNGTIDLNHVSTDKNEADILTKYNPKDKFNHLDLLG